MYGDFSCNRLTKNNRNVEKYHARISSTHIRNSHFFSSLQFLIASFYRWLSFPTALYVVQKCVRPNKMPSRIGCSKMKHIQTRLTFHLHNTCVVVWLLRVCVCVGSQFHCISFGPPIFLIHDTSPCKREIFRIGINCAAVLSSLLFVRNTLTICSTPAYVLFWVWSAFSSL